MKIYRYIFIFLTSIVYQSITAQDASPSAYSFFGLGDPSFTGTTENISMGGIHVYSDSLHYTISSPATLSRLKYINMELGLKNNFIQAEDASGKEWMSAHNISYFALAIPFGKKYALGFGLLPVNTSGYKIYTKTDTGVYTFDGEGGNNRLFVAGSYRITPALSVGVEYQYYFGQLKRENLWVPNNVITYTKENNMLDFAGSTFKLSAFYQYKLKKDKYINANINYRFQNQLEAEYKYVSQIITIVNGSEDLAEIIIDDKRTGNLNLPPLFNFGLGTGQTNKWFLGAEYSFSDLSSYKNPYYDPSYVKYHTATELHLGGMYVPQYNSVSKYWKRITYRFGAYYKDTGMNLYNEDISDFGITFGLGLPALRGISNMNIGFELGQRGKNTNRLVKEQYINLHIGISLNDTWFIKRKIK